MLEFQQVVLPELSCCFSLFWSSFQHVLRYSVSVLQHIFFRLFEINFSTNTLFLAVRTLIFLQLHLSKLKLHYLSWCGCRCHRTLFARTIFQLRLKWADFVLAVLSPLTYENIFFELNVWKVYGSTIIKSNYFEVSFMMYETKLGTKTQLGTYSGNCHIFCFGPLANTSQCQPLPNKYPALAVMSKCD